MNHPPDEQRLRDALEAFETALETPVISGDLSQWADYLQSTWGQVEPVVRHHLDDSFREQLDQIAREDPELLNSVEQLRAETEAIRQQCGELGDDVSRLAELAARIEQHENRAAGGLESIVRDGLEFVTRVHRLLVATQAWLVEAVNRERGPGD